MAAGSFYGPPGGGGAPSFYGPPGGAGAGAPSFYGPPGGGGASPSFYGPSSSGPSHWGDMSFQAGPTTIFKITASARNLPKMDGLLGKADPYVVVNTPAAGPAKPKKAIVKTEVIRNDLNPTWKPFEIDAAEAGGETTPLLWELYDWDADGSHDFIGSFTASLQQIASQPRFQILNPNRKSTFGRAKPESGDFHVIKVERETRAPKALPQAIRFVFRGEKLAKKDLLTSDPFLVFWATPLPSASGLPQDQVAALQQQVDGRPAGTPRVQVIIAKTEVIQSNLNPTWQPIEIPLELTGGMDAKMTVICWDFDDDGTHDEIGRTVVSLRDLIQKDPMIPLIDPAKKGGLTYTNSGLLRVSHFEEIPQGPPVPKPLAFDLSISCSKLARMDATGKSDPFLQISARIPLKQKEGKAVIYKSEVLHQTLSGTFRPFQLTVVDCGGLDNPLTFSVYDKDDRGQELIGAFKTTLRELSFQKANIHHLVNPAHKLSSYSGIIKVTSCSPSFTITPTGVLAPAYRIQAAGKAMFRTSNVFTVYAGTKAGPVLYRSQAVANNKNPVFDAFVIETQKAGGLDGPLYFEFSDPSPGTKSPFVGQFTSSLRELNMFRTSPLIPIIDPAQDGRVGYRSSGDFEIQHVEPLVDPAPPAWGAPPPGQWGAPPGGYGGPPAASQWGAPPGGYGGPPAASQWGPPPGGAPPGGYGGPPAASQWGPPPGGAPPGGYGGPPAASQWGPPPGGAPPGGYGGPPAASQWGAPPGGAPPGGAPPGGYCGPPAASQWGPPPGGAPPSGYGGPPAASQWGPPPGGAPPGGAPPAGGAPAGGAPPGGAPPPAASQWGPPPGGAPPGGYYGAPPSDGGYGAPPGGYGAPPGGYGGPPAASQWGPPPGGSPAPSHYGAPPGGYGAPPGGYGAPPGGSH